MTCNERPVQIMLDIQSIFRMRIQKHIGNISYVSLIVESIFYTCFYRVWVTNWTEDQHLNKVPVLLWETHAITWALAIVQTPELHTWLGEWKISIYEHILERKVYHDYKLNICEEMVRNIKESWTNIAFQPVTLYVISINACNGVE